MIMKIPNAAGGSLLKSMDQEMEIKIIKVDTKIRITLKMSIITRHMAPRFL